MWRVWAVSADTPVRIRGRRPPKPRPGARMGSAALPTLEADVALPIAAGAVLILLIVVGSVVLVLRPSDTSDRRP